MEKNIFPVRKIIFYNYKSSFSSSINDKKLLFLSSINDKMRIWITDDMQKG